MRNSIPKHVATQGVDVVNQYSNIRESIDEARKECTRIKDEIDNMNDHLFDIYKRNPYMVNPTSYLNEFGLRKSYLNLSIIQELSKRNVELCLEFMEFDTRQLLLRKQLYENGWMEDWQKKEWEKFSVKEVK